MQFHDRYIALLGHIYNFVVWYGSGSNKQLDGLMHKMLKWPMFLDVQCCALAIAHVLLSILLVKIYEILGWEQDN